MRFSEKDYSISELRDFYAVLIEENITLKTLNHIIISRHGLIKLTFNLEKFYILNKMKKNI